MSFQSETSQTPLSKTCFVTIGATAPFDALIDAVFAEDFLSALVEASYTKLRVQYGNTPLPSPLPTKYKTLEIEVFDFKPDLVAQFVDCDLVLSHAGTGTILEAMRYQKRLICVPNEKLMDNHQLQLALELEKQGYMTAALPRNVARAISKAEATHMKHMPRTDGTAFAQVIDEEIGSIENYQEG